jgi:proton glutamate symport protein
MKLIAKYYQYILLAAFTVIVLLHLLVQFSDIGIVANLLIYSRWIGTSLLIIFAVSKKKLTVWIFASIIVGCLCGIDFPEFASKLQFISNIFIRLIKTIVAPLIFATLVTGIAAHGNLRQVGRMGWKSLLYFEIVSTIGLFIGLAAINISQAGVGISSSVPENTATLNSINNLSGLEIIEHSFPENIAKAIYEGQILQVVIFSIIFGIATALLKEKQRNTITSFTNALSEVMFKFTNIVMYLAPLAVGAAIAVTVGSMGISVLLGLFKLIATLYFALIVFLVFVLLPIAYFYKIPVKQFVIAISEPASIAFATTSSESALPRAMEILEKFGVNRRVVSFVMPTGYSFNLDGTTLYLSMASIFVAQAAGIHLDLTQQLLIAFTLMLTSKGVAGVPRSSLIILLGTCATFNLPVTPVFIIFSVDILLDMARTTVNLIGNCLATVVIAKMESEFDMDAANNYSIKN